MSFHFRVRILYNTHIPLQYYILYEIKVLLRVENLRILHQNICSILAKFYKFCILRVRGGWSKHMEIFHVIPSFLIHKIWSTYMLIEKLHMFEVGINARKFEMDFHNRGKHVKEIIICIVYLFRG